MEPIQREEVIIEVEDLKSQMENPNLRLFDATVLMNQPEGEPDAKQVYGAGHISGAAFLDHGAISDPDSKYQLTLPEPSALAIDLGNLGIDNNSMVVVYSTGMLVWATRVWWVLRYAGHKNVRVLNGGLEAWKNVGGEMQTGVNSYPKAEFNIDPQSGYFVDKEGMQQALQDPNVVAVHSLPEQVYQQAHIPSSVCQPCTDFLGNGTTLLPDDDLRKILVSDSSTTQTITYCGGGVAATVNAIVCRMFGNPNVSVYDGSMSEWVGEGLPVDSAQ